MATHDYIIANASGAAVRADLNNALAAIVSNNSNATEPATTYAYQWWADTTANVLKIRNSANDAWITLMELDGTRLIEDGTAAAPGLAFADDTNTGLFSPAANQLGIATSGVERVEFGTTEVVFNDGGANVDFRVEGDTEPNLIFVDAGNNRVGMGTDSPAAALHVKDAAATVALIERPGATSNVALEFKNDTSSMFCGLSTSAEGFSIDEDNNLGSVPHFTVKRTTGQIVCGAPTVSTAIDHSIITQGRLETEATYNSTTTSAANVTISSDGLLKRSTSSRRYKTNIETLEDSYSDAVLNARPVWFNSTATDDTAHPEWGYWGFIAEEIADIDPRLVFYSEDSEGNLQADGVQYDRFVPHLINLVKRQKDQIADLTTRLEALEAAG